MIPLAALIHAASTTVATKKPGPSILDPIAKPLGWILAGVYAVIPNYGVAIIGLSLLWMLIIAPLTLKSTRSMLAMQKLQPELKKLQDKHKDDRQAFAQAQMDLFREHNVSPFGSCLPLLLPMPVFFALFRVINGLGHSTKTVFGVVTYTPKYLDHGTRMYKDIQHSHGHLVAFGMDLTKSALSHHNGVLAAAPFWIALLAMAATSYFQSAMMMNRNQAAAAANPQMRMMKFLAPLFALICIKFPAGVVVYYATSNLCRILQQDAMYRYDPKVKALVTQEVAEVEELTQEIDERERQRPGYTPPRGPKPEPAKAPKAGGGTGAPTGRSRFRDLLAAAAEQQKAQQETKKFNDGKSSGDNGSPGSNGTAKNGGKGAGGTTRAGGGGQKAGGGSGGSSGGSGGSGGQNRNRPAGNRTNRKRRGR